MQIRDGGLHVALCFEDAADAPRQDQAVRRHELFDERMLAAIGPDHRLAGRARIRLSELAGDPWLAATRDGLIHRACRAAGFEPRIRYLTSDPLAIRGLVAAGLAVTLTSQLLAPDLTEIRTLALFGDAPRRLVYAVTPPVGVQPLVAPFLAALRDEARRLRSK